MKKDGLSFIASFMPPLCMAFMLGFKYLLDSNMVEAEEYLVASAEILPFLLPFLIIVFLRRAFGDREAEIGLRLGGFTRHAVPFVLLMSLTVALMSFLLNAGAQALFGLEATQTVAYSGSVGISALLVVVLPSIFEELFFRSGMLCAFERQGTWAAIFVSAITFALVHGSLGNLVGPLAAGLVYGYMTYILGSIWPAVFAHMLNNLCHLILGYMARTYAAVGIWPYFMLLSVFVFALFAYFSMRSLGKLVERGKVRRFKAVGLRRFGSALLFAPGLWLLVLMFIIKVAY